MERYSFEGHRAPIVTTIAAQYGRSPRFIPWRRD